MTVLLHDARQRLAASSVTCLSPELLVHDIMYADDTLLIDTGSNALETAMKCVGHIDLENGMVFNFAKLEAIPVRTTAVLRKPDGTSIASK